MLNHAIIDEAGARARFEEILNDVQRQSIAIRRDGRDLAILMSTADYERLRLGAVREFLDLRDDLATKASAAGLTEEGVSNYLMEDLLILDPNRQFTGWQAVRHECRD